MKRILPLLLLLSLTAFSAHAQTEVIPDEDEAASKTAGLRLPTRTGNYLIGANVLLANLSFQKGFEATYNVGLDPRIGVFILPNIALGISGDLRVEGREGYRAINYGVSPFARVYFAHDNGDKPDRPLQFFIEAGIGVGGANSRYDNGGVITRATTNGARFYFQPGVDYFLNDHIAAEIGLEYLFISGKPDAHIVSFNAGFQIFLGR